MAPDSMLIAWLISFECLSVPTSSLKKIQPLYGFEKIAIAKTDILPVYISI